MVFTKTTKRLILSSTLLALLLIGVLALYVLPPQEAPARPVIVLSDGVNAPKGMAWVPGGVFMMGSTHKLAPRNEGPAHLVKVNGFWMDQTHVTNDQFAEFVHKTGYITTAEKKPDWESIRVQLPPATPRPPDSLLVPGSMVFVGTNQPVNLRLYVNLSG